jgi:hypothetical protein
VVDPPATGALPLPQTLSGRLPLPESAAGYLSSNGELPVQRVQGSLVDPEPLPQREVRAPSTALETTGAIPKPAIRRTKVTFTPTAPSRLGSHGDDDVRVYLAPPVDGLSTFDLGSVPASVTPPKTWRKAAWFAAVSSGGVVVSLLFAGTLLVGKPDIDQATQGWPGYQGGTPQITGEQNPAVAGVADGTTKRSPGGTRPDSSTRSTTPTEQLARNDGGMNPPAAPPVATSGPVMTGSPTSGNPVPPKPPYTPPPRETTPPPWYSAPVADAQTMGDNTETFFNAVPSDPAAASNVTTGELHDQGPQALKQRYANVAYFQVKNISIDQDRGVTVSTVEITQKDGTQSLQQQTLTFSDDGKIESDGK